MSKEKIAESILVQFDKLVAHYKKFNFLFLGALLVESLLLIFFFPFLIKSAFFAITLAALLITLFSFYTLRNYQGAEKEAAFRELNERYIKGVLSIHSNAKTPKEIKQVAAEACLALAERLKGRRASLRGPSFLKVNEEKIGHFLGNEEIRRFQEVLYQRAIDELSGQVRLAPCDIAAHAHLARAFVLISDHHGTAQPEGFNQWRRRAIEEYKILSELAPQEGWILLELAARQQELGQTSAEIETLEKFLHLDPQNVDTLYRLGQLYFKEGQASKGFKIFENLKKIDLIKSDQLIAYYS